MSKEFLISSFKIKRIQSSTERDFVKALKIYNDTIPVEIKTDTNEITYFVDLKEKREREMYFFCLYYNNSVIGYIEAAYLLKTKTIVIDYIAMDKEYRINGIFYPLFSLFQQYFSDNLIDYDYILSEVSLRTIEEHVDDESYYNRTLLKLEDFRLLDINYPQPKLGSQNIESNFNMGLMIKTKHPILELKTETVINIIKNIYYDHYYDWYQTFMNEDESKHYHNHLDILMSGIDSESSEQKYIKIRDSAAEGCEYYLSNECFYKNVISTAGFKSANSGKQRIARLLIIFFVFAVSMILSYVIYYIFKIINLPSEHVAPIASSAASILMGLLTLALSTKKH